MNLQHQAIIRAALNKSVIIQDVSSYFGKEAHLLQKNNTKELIVEGAPTSLISLRTKYFCDNKQLTKKVFDDCQMRSPKSFVFTSLQDKILENIWEEGKVYVAKPLDMGRGEGVVMHINSPELLEKYWQEHTHLAKYFMLEEQIEGEDLRIQVIGGKIVAACRREPAYVIGNGKDTLVQLITIRQEVIKKQSNLNKLELDSTSYQLLQKQEFNLKSIIPNDVKVHLKDLANMSQGAVAIDVTDQIHPTFHNWVSRISSYLESSYFGIDFISLDNTQDPLTHTQALEINNCPDWLHHTFSEIKQHDIAAILIDNLFE